MTEVIIDGVRYVPEQPRAVKISIYGMYDCHAFQRFTGSTVEEVVEDWLEHSYENESCRYGATDLCPATLLDKNGKEIRRVGGCHLITYPSYYRKGDYSHLHKLDMGKLDRYIADLKADPDVVRLLATTRGER